MFTGLVQGLGTLLRAEGDRFNVTVQPQTPSSIMADLAIGDSVAVDGVCLTVETILSDGFVATVSPETLKRTTLGNRHQGASYVNLESSLRVGSKLGGHFVTGHVDGLGCLVESLRTDTAWEMTFAAPPDLSDQWDHAIARYIVPKGSVSVNGISLTVADCDRQGRYFKTAVIPHTYQQTNLSLLKMGSWVNLEGDILGKYVEKLLETHSDTLLKPEAVSLSFLEKHGYL